MFFKLIGFTHQGTVRRFVFHRVETGPATITFTVLVDLELARHFGIGVQDFPTLCSRKLLASFEHEPESLLSLTEDDMRLFAAEKAGVAADETAKRAERSRRGSLAAAARPGRDAGTARAFGASGTQLLGGSVRDTVIA